MDTATLTSRAPLTQAAASGHWVRVAAVYGAPCLVVMAALFVAGIDYGRFLHDHRHLWTGTIHDRHAHYVTAVNLALDLRGGDPRAFLHDFDGARVWPPLHGLLVASVLTVTGLDYRLGVLPNVLAYGATVLLGFLIARRAVTRGGNLAGFVAALFILTNPAFRAFATDYMLESLGACLTLLALYLYVVTVQGTSSTNGRWLGLALTALFLTKYNYWSLVIFALVAAELTTRPRIYWQMFADVFATLDTRSWLNAQLRQPLNYVLVAVLAVLTLVMTTGGTSLQIAGLSISLHTQHNLIHIAYAIVWLRIFLWWRRERGDVLPRLDERARPLLAWHVIPVTVWFLLPKRLSYFLWYLSPANTGEVPHYSLKQSLGFYIPCLTDDYGGGVVLTCLTVALTVLAFLSFKRLRPGGRVLLCFLIIALVLTLHHPNRKSRYVHSWVAVGWVTAGIGLARLVNGRATRRWAWGRPWLTAATLGGLSAVCLPQLAEAARAPEGGVQPRLPSSLELTDRYLPALADARRPTVLATLPMKFLCQWAYLECYGRARPLETDIRGYEAKPEGDADAFTRWLETTSCDTLVFIDVPPGSAFYEHVPICEPYDRLRDLLDGQTRFRIAARYYLPEYGCTVSIWKP